MPAEVWDRFSFRLQNVPFGCYQMPFDFDYLSLERDNTSCYRFDGLQEGGEYRLLERPQVERFVAVL